MDEETIALLRDVMEESTPELDVLIRRLAQGILEQEAKLDKLTAFVTAIAADHYWPEYTRKKASEVLREVENL